LASESSAPRRPTHDTSTSRREVKITHTHTHKTQTYKYTMKITGLIASTMLLLMASAPSGLLASPDGQPSIVPVEEIKLSDGLSTGIGQRQDVVKRKLGLSGYAHKIIADERKEMKTMIRQRRERRRERRERRRDAKKRREDSSNRKSRGGTQLGGYAQKIIAEEREERKPMRRERQERRSDAKKKSG